MTILHDPRAVVAAFGGQEAVGEVVRRKRPAVANAVARECFPSDWFDLLDRAARAKGYEIARGAFGFLRFDDFEPVSDDEARP